MASDANGATDHQRSEFETRRAELIVQIGDSLENVLSQINGLNRSLEGIIELIKIGNEFASVEALWSQFEAVAAEGNADNNDSLARDQGNGRDATTEPKR